MSDDDKGGPKEPNYPDPEEIKKTLEGMFGQTAGVGETTILNKLELSKSPTQSKIVKNDKIEVKQNIKVVNFDKENIDKNQNKIKIKRF